MSLLLVARLISGPLIKRNTSPLYCSQSCWWSTKRGHSLLSITAVQCKSYNEVVVLRLHLWFTEDAPINTLPCLIFDEWQEVWNCCAGNKLHAIRPTVGYCKQKTCLSRCDIVLLNRLRIGHTRLTHFFLLSGDELPECGTCQCPLTVKHILVECVDLKDIRKLFSYLIHHINRE